MLSQNVSDKLPGRATKSLEYGQIALFRNVENKLPLMLKIYMKWTDMLSPFIGKILPLSANIT
jgi:hypothetical protein